MANRTIIEAAKMAYTQPKLDISGQLESMAAISKMVTTMATAASKRTDQLNKSFNAIDWLGHDELYKFGSEIRNRKDLSHGQKMQVFKDIKNSMNVLETWSKNVGDLFANDGENMSGAVNSKTKNWLSSVITGSFYGPNSIQDRNNDGVITEDESKIKPVIFKDNTLKILSPEGIYVSVDELPSNFTEKSDSDALASEISKVSSGIGIKGRSVTDFVEQSMVGIKSSILKNKKATQSLMYDEIFLMPGHSGGISFVDWFLDNSNIWDMPADKQDVGDKIQEELDKMSVSGFDKKSAEEFKNNLFRELSQYVDVEEDLINFLQQSIEHSLRDLY